MPKTDVRRHPRNKPSGGQTNVRDHERRVHTPPQKPSDHWVASSRDDITIEMYNGELNDIHNLPPGWDYILVDHDFQDEEDEAKMLDALHTELGPTTMRIHVLDGVVGRVENVPRGMEYNVSEYGEED